LGLQILPVLHYPPERPPERPKPQSLPSQGQPPKGAFHKPYSNEFRRGADNNNMCPCSHATPPSSALSPAKSDSSGFDRLMAKFLSPRSHPCNSLPRHQCQQPRPSRTRFPNSTNHILFTCPLHNSPCRHLFGIHPTEPYIFGTEKGGTKLGAFQCITNRLLRPLPQD